MFSRVSEPVTNGKGVLVAASVMVNTGIYELMVGFPVRAIGIDVSGG